mgnify:CR=1 FL=1
MWAAKERETRVVACDPAALLVAKPLARALTPGEYELLHQSNEQNRVRALLLRRRKAGAAVSVEAGDDIAIDTAAIALIASHEHQRLLAARDRERALRTIIEAPRGSFTIPIDDGDVFGFAALVAGDGRANTRWLLDRKKQIVALHIALPAIDAEAADASTILANLPPPKK